MKNVYLAGKLFSFFDRACMLDVCKQIESIQNYSKYKVYLPYRDSNLVVSNQGDIARNIFLNDVRQLDITDIFVGKIDGMAYDSGIGFEVGYSLGKKIPIVVFSTDFYDTAILDKKISFSPVINEIANCFKYDFYENCDLGYEEILRKNIVNFYDYIKKMMQDSSILPYELPEASVSSDQSIIFVDFFGCQYEWARKMSEIIRINLINKGYKVYISDRYINSADVINDIKMIMSSKYVITCLDGMEPDFDTCILQGFAYSLGKTILGYETSAVKRFVEGKQKMCVNLMNEHSCTQIFHSLDDIIRFLE